MFSRTLESMAHIQGPRLLGHARLLGKGAAPFSSSSSALEVLTLPNGNRHDIAPSEIALGMPAEYAPHSGCWIAWPRRPEIWRNNGAPAKAAFTEVIEAINQFEPVTVVAHNDQVGPVLLTATAAALMPEQSRTLAVPRSPQGGA